jgi:antitoxin YefM
MNKTVSYTEARANFASLLDEAADTLLPVIIERRGKPPVALIDAAELSSLLETVHLFRSPANAKALLAALEEEPIPMTLEEFLSGQWKNSVPSLNHDSSPIKPGGSNKTRKSLVKSTR